MYLYLMHLDKLIYLLYMLFYVKVYKYYSYCFFKMLFLKFFKMLCFMFNCLIHNCVYLYLMHLDKLIYLLYMLFYVYYECTLIKLRNSFPSKIQLTIYEYFFITPMFHLHPNRTNEAFKSIENPGKNLSLAIFSYFNESSFEMFKTCSTVVHH